MTIFFATAPLVGIIFEILRTIDNPIVNSNYISFQNVGILSIKSNLIDAGG